MDVATSPSTIVMDKFTSPSAIVVDEVTSPAVSQAVTCCLVHYFLESIRTSDRHYGYLL